MKVHRQKTSHGLTRRRLLGASAAGAFVLAAPAIVTAQSKRVKIGYITALSGSRAEFGESDPWMLTKIRGLLANGLKVGSSTYEVEIVMRDNQSSMNRSASVGSELILRQAVDMLLVQDLDASVATGELSDINGVPSMSTMGPWQAWMFPRGGKPDTGFPWTFTFFWGADDAMATFTRLWDSIDTNKLAGDFYLDNPVGQSLADPKRGLPGFMQRGGYTRVPGGMFKLQTDDFSVQVATFKDAGADIVTGFCFPPHWATFWNQAAQAGFRPEAATMVAAFLFPSALDALGARGEGMSTEVWWTPRFPYVSSLTGQSAAELAAEWEAASGAQWTQTLGYSHALFEVGLAAMRDSGDPRDRAAVRDAMAGMTLDTIVGPVNFGQSPIKNVAITPLAGGQWRRSTGGRFMFDLLVTDNKGAPDVPLDAEFVPLSKLG